MGKGDWSRPMVITYDEYTKRWNETFGPKRRLEDAAADLGVRIDTRGDVGSDEGRQSGSPEHDS